MRSRPLAHAHNSDQHVSRIRYDSHNVLWQKFVAGDLPGADYIMRHTLWLGVYPGLTDAHIDHVIATLSRFVRQSPLG